MIERKIEKLELVIRDSIAESVSDFFRRNPSKRGAKRPWSPSLYPTSSEKELYPEIGHILLRHSERMMRGLLDRLGTPIATELAGSPLRRTWRGYRVSTVRVDPSGPMCFPGGAGKGAIADLGFFHYPAFDDERLQIVGDPILYFEVKWADNQRHKPSQLESHLSALESDAGAAQAYLGAIGGRPVDVSHPRWLGHVSLESFFETTRRVAEAESDVDLASQIAALRDHRRAATTA